jgi:hypothetical protein
MLTTLLKGGLGNQLFQISTLINLAMQNREIYFIDLNLWPPKGGADTDVWQAGEPKTYLNNVYRNLPIGSVRELKFKPSYIHREAGQQYSKIPFSKNMLLDGYFASEKYFKNIEHILRELFSPPPEHVENFNRKYRSDKQTELVSIHVRRGAYLANLKHHNICNLDYYNQAMSNFDQSKTKFIIFSDDLEWCKKNFKDVYFAEGQKDFEDFYDMMLCDHNIIANSTFSWWAAWLNKNRYKKVVSPEIWFGPANSHLTIEDLIPKEWILI